jgi:hypothetical protein
VAFGLLLGLKVLFQLINIWIQIHGHKFALKNLYMTTYNIEALHLTKKQVGACWTLEPTILPPTDIPFPKFPNLHLH